MRRHLVASLLLAGICGLGLVLGGCSSEGCGHEHHKCHTSHQPSWHGYCAQSECCDEDSCCQEKPCCKHRDSCCEDECEDECCEDSCAHEECCKSQCKCLAVWYACPRCEFVSASPGTCVHCGAPLEQRQGGTVTSPEGRGGQPGAQPPADPWGGAQQHASICPTCGRPIVADAAPSNTKVDVQYQVVTPSVKGASSTRRVKKPVQTDED